MDHMDYKLTLTTLFNACFAHSKILKCWIKAIISPIPKSSLKDSFFPVSYRGVSLFSHVENRYSQIFKKCIMSLFENVEMFCEEQNDFRKSRSCEDHIYTLTYIIRTCRRLSTGLTETSYGINY